MLPDTTLVLEVLICPVTGQSNKDWTFTALAKELSGLFIVEQRIKWDLVPELQLHWEKTNCIFVVETLNFNPLITSLTARKTGRILSVSQEDFRRLIPTPPNFKARYVYVSESTYKLFLDEHFKE